MNESSGQTQAFSGPALSDLISPERLGEALQASRERKIPLSHVLHYEYNVPREDLLRALADFFDSPVVEYDERLPIPPELLRGTNSSCLAKGQWFPISRDASGNTVIAAAEPDASDLSDSIASLLGPGPTDYRPALPDDISWFIQDFLHAPPGELIGTERTGLAFWRNTLAQWRTRMACYRTDLARARTALSSGRSGMALATIAEHLWRHSHYSWHSVLPPIVLVFGVLLTLFSIPVYLRVRRSRLTPPRNQTLVEVTAATLLFLEDYHFAVHPPPDTGPRKNTMLARLGDFLADYSTILRPVPASRERTYLARERNVLAAQRTLAACYRTIYARARTGLAFIRTGVYTIGVGIGLVSYFGWGGNLFLDGILLSAGVALIVDGLLWYLPVRGEQSELPRSRGAALDGSYR